MPNEGKRVFLLVLLLHLAAILCGPTILEDAAKRRHLRIDQRDQRIQIDQATRPRHRRKWTLDDWRWTHSNRRQP